MQKCGLASFVWNHFAVNFYKKENYDLHLKESGFWLIQTAGSALLEGAAQKVVIDREINSINLFIMFIYFDLIQQYNNKKWSKKVLYIFLLFSRKKLTWLTLCAQNYITPMNLTHTLFVRLICIRNVVLLCLFFLCVFKSKFIVNKRKKFFFYSLRISVEMSQQVCCYDDDKNHT